MRGYPALGIRETSEPHKPERFKIVLMYQAMMGIHREDSGLQRADGRCESAPTPLELAPELPK
jgi:hypothetical protein